MKKFKIQSFLQKSFFKKNILRKTLSKFFTLINISRGTWKISFNHFRKKNIESFISEKFQLNYALFILSIVFFLYLLYLSIPGILVNENIHVDKHVKDPNVNNMEEWRV